MPLSFTADENVDRQIVQALRSSGHSVLYIAEYFPGCSDEQVLRQAAERESVLLTTDKDFGELVFRQQKMQAGVVLVRLHSLPPLERVRRVVEIADRHGEALREAFTVVTPKAVRFRKVP